MINQKDYQNVLQKSTEAIGRAKRVAVISHQNPHGDEIGAMSALSFVFDTLGLDHGLISLGGVPENYQYLGNVHRFFDHPDILTKNNFDLAIILGCKDIKMTGLESELAELKPLLVNVNDHQDAIDFADINICRDDVSSSAEIVYDLIKLFPVNIDKRIANGILTGIFTDTGGFRHANTSPKTLELAAELLLQGARVDLIARKTFFEKSISTLKTYALVFDRVRIDPKTGAAVAMISHEDLQEIGTTEQDLEGLSSIINTIEGIKFSLLLTERSENEIKGSLRSEHDRGVNVSKIAQVFGGGGHRLAAGFVIKGKMVKTLDGRLMVE